ncbi:MAG: GatB/YqeY domain-containing protein [Acidobacteria bacterium]|nr:MAG: GatB/YqeY domain-containing protein [Acidobacteriota bacterium]
MTLMEQVNKAITEAMKARDPGKLLPLRMLKAALTNREVERAQPLTPAEELQVLSGLVKQRRESIEQFVRGGRQDLADKEAAEITVLQAYLPPALGEEELARLVREVVAETGASSAKDLGRVMKAVMARVPAGAADGKLVNEIVRRQLVG